MLLIYPKVAFSNRLTMNGDITTHDMSELSRSIAAYVIRVRIDDLKVPPRVEQNAEHAAAPRQLVIDSMGSNGSEMAAPIVVLN